MAQVHQPTNMQHQVTGWAGWISFAAFMMALSGIVHIIYGIAGVIGQDWYLYASGTTWWFDSSTWGWTLIAGGVLLLMTSALLFAGNMAGRIAGGVVALASLAANVAVFPIAPVWSTIAIVVDLMILYAIVAHGSEMKQLRDEAA
jgi:hypothetical protein